MNTFINTNTSYIYIYIGSYISNLYVIQALLLNQQYAFDVNSLINQEIPVGISLLQCNTKHYVNNVDKQYIQFFVFKVYIYIFLYNR